MTTLLQTPFIFVCIALINGLAVDARYSPPGLHIPEPDGLFHVHMLPVGQGDGMVIQCPSGDLTIMDLGTSDAAADAFWGTPEIQTFLEGSFNRIINVILSHNLYDHYSLMPSVMGAPADMSGLQSMYITCTHTDLPASIQTWLTGINATDKVRMFNNGKPCGPYANATCEGINLCPNDLTVITRVLAVNLGQQCVTGNKNIDSIVFKVTSGGTSIIFNGDFEDFTTNNAEDGPQKALVDFYGSEMLTTFYKLSHHGAGGESNKPISQTAHFPKAIFVSGNPWYSSTYRHPRCLIIDGFVNDVGSLCRPNIDCGPHAIPGTPAELQLHANYTCGEETGTVPDLRLVTNNELAIYMTVPTENIMNLVQLSIDGTNGNWGVTLTSFSYTRR